MWSQSTAGVVNKIVLGGDFRTRNNAAGEIDNPTNDAATMVFDLNGHTANFDNAVNAQTTWDITWESSTPGGVFSSDTIGVPAGAVVGADVIVQVNSNGGNRFDGTWDPSTTVRLRSDRTLLRVDFIKGDGIGNIGVGGQAFTQTLRVAETNSGAPTHNIKGDVTLDTNGILLFDPNNSQGTKLLVGGNFTDVNTDSAGYGADSDDRLIFGLDPASPRTVSIGRTGLGVDIQVGNTIGTASDGDIVLGADLSTTGTFDVLGGSALDVAEELLSTGDLTLESGSSLSYTLGSDLGRIDVTGAVSVGGNLFLDTSGLLTDHNAIVLIDNDGSDAVSGMFANAPPGTTFSTPVGTYRLVYDFRGNDVALVPEPGTLGVLVLGLGALARRRIQR